MKRIVRIGFLVALFFFAFTKAAWAQQCGTDTYAQGSSTYPTKCSAQIAGYAVAQGYGGCPASMSCIIDKPGGGGYQVSLCGQSSIDTAIGCIPATPQEFITKFLSVGIGMAGGIAFLLILFGGMQMMTSAGNPERLMAGRELISSAIAGLFFIIFSVFILKLVGVNILRIPGFS